MAALRRSAAPVTRMARSFSTRPLPLPMYQAMVEKVQQIKPACSSVEDVSKSVQLLETNLNEYNLIWKVNERKQLHEAMHGEGFPRRNYRLAVVATSVAMFIATKAAKVFT